MKSLFEKGFSYRSFMLNQPKEIRAKIMHNYIPLEVKAEHRSSINSIGKKVRILGIVDGRCPDCQAILPLLEKLISTNNNIELRLLTVDYLSGELKDFEIDGRVNLPTFVFMNEEGNIKGTFVEKPKSGTADTAEELVGLILNTNAQ